MSSADITHHQRVRLNRVFRNRETAARRLAATENALHQAIREVHAESEGKISYAKLAEAVALSKSRIEQIINGTTGRSR